MEYDSQNNEMCKITMNALREFALGVLVCVNEGCPGGEKHLYVCECLFFWSGISPPGGKSGVVGCEGSENCSLLGSAAMKVGEGAAAVHDNRFWCLGATLIMT